MTMTKTIQSYTFVILVMWCYDVRATTSAPSAHYLLTQHLRSREAIKGKVPPGGGVNPVQVHVDFYLFDVLDIDDIKQVFCNQFIKVISLT